MHNRIWLGSHPYAPRNQGYLTVASTDPSKFLNIIFDSTRGYNQVTLSPAQAKQLRDELNRAYPVTAAPAPAYTVPPHRAVGNHIVALFEDGKYKPNSAPYVHTNLAAATHEAERLAKTHGKDFVVFKPVVAAKAEVIKTVNVKVVNAF